MSDCFVSGYKIQTEPERPARSYYWKTAIGLQDVDNITPSKYLIETANENIEGRISFYEAERRVEDYYLNKPARGSRTEEADKVALRIAGILMEDAFTLSPAELISIHKRLFTGLYPHAGKIREYNIAKEEWVLNGKSVLYAGAHNLREALDYDFDREREFDYSKLDLKSTVSRIVKFISDLWQIHAFGEGNTRTIAVFAVKYLRMFGYDITNDTFEANSWYFRNALVRANYNDNKNNVKATYEYLNRFFANLLFGESNELKNRELII